MTKPVTKRKCPGGAGHEQDHTITAIHDCAARSLLLQARGAAEVQDLAKGDNLTDSMSYNSLSCCMTWNHMCNLRHRCVEQAALFCS